MKPIKLSVFKTITLLALISPLLCIAPMPSLAQSLPSEAIVNTTKDNLNNDHLILVSPNKIVKVWKGAHHDSNVLKPILNHVLIELFNNNGQVFATNLVFTNAIYSVSTKNIPYTKSCESIHEASGQKYDNIIEADNVEDSLIISFSKIKSNIYSFNFSMNNLIKMSEIKNDSCVVEVLFVENINLTNSLDLSKKEIFKFAIPNNNKGYNTVVVTIL